MSRNTQEMKSIFQSRSTRPLLQGLSLIFVHKRRKNSKKSWLINQYSFSIDPKQYVCNNKLLSFYSDKVFLCT